MLADYAAAHGLALDESVAYADSASDLAMLEAVGFPVAVNPETRLAAIARRRGWHVEHWAKAPGGPTGRCPSGPSTGPAVERTGWQPDPGPGRARARSGPVDEGAGLRAQPAPLRRRPGGLGPRVGPGRRRRAAAPDREPSPPSCPGPDWHRVHPLLSGICGSDLATVDGRSSRYFEDIVSFPFVPGHEVVGTLEDAGRGGRRDRSGAGARVVIEPVLGCAARAIEPPCPACAEGRTGDCEHVAFGHLPPGPADRLLRRHRRRLVGGRPGGPPEPAARRARRP